MIWLQCPHLNLMASTDRGVLARLLMNALARLYGTLEILLKKILWIFNKKQQAAERS